MYPVELDSQRLRLREFGLADVNDVYAYASDGDATRFMTWPVSEKPEDSLPFVRSAMRWALEEPRTRYELALEIDGQVVGGCGVRINPYNTNEAELGYILHKDLWNQGLISEAAALIIGFAFDNLSVGRVVAHYDVDNLASGRVMAKLGMQWEGRSKGYTHDRSGELRDYDSRAVLAFDWRAQNGGSRVQ